MKSKIILAGGSGFLGMSLSNYFKDNCDVVILSRTNKEDKDEILYQPPIKQNASQILI